MQGFKKRLCNKEIPPPLCRACRPTPRRHSARTANRQSCAKWRSWRPLPRGNSRLSWSMTPNLWMRRRGYHHSPTQAMQPAGQDPEARLLPGTVTVPLCSRTKASPFWIMLLLVLGRSEHGMTPGALPALARAAGLSRCWSTSGAGTLRSRSKLHSFCDNLVATTRQADHKCARYSTGNPYRGR